jgi:potassium voltage-gated channel Eag-related subfamily H protein
MQKSCRVGFMYGELTDKKTIEAIDEALETHQTEQFEILLYKKNRKFGFLTEKFQNCTSETVKAWPVIRL